MIPIFISIIAFLLLAFEVGTGVAFSKDLNSNILVLALIMILPWIFLMIRHDVEMYHGSITGHIQGKVLKRKRLIFFLDTLFRYSIAGLASGMLFLGLFIILGNPVAITYTLILNLCCLGINTLTIIFRELHP